MTCGAIGEARQRNALHDGRPATLTRSTPMNNMTNEEIAAVRAEIAAEWKRAVWRSRLEAAGALLFIGALIALIIPAL